jgi:hypothetical protein
MQDKVLKYFEEYFNGQPNESITHKHLEKAVIDLIVLKESVLKLVEVSPEEETEREKLPAGTEFVILKQRRRLEKEFPGDAQKQIKTSPQLIQPKLTTGLHGKSIKGTPIKGPPPPSEIESETKSAAKSAGDVLQAIRGIKGRKKKEEQGQTHLFKTT